MRLLIVLILLTGCTQVDAYFCPGDNCHEVIIAEIEKAEHEILFATYSFTHPAIATAITIKAHENVSVRGIIDQSYYSQFDRLAYQGIDVTKDSKPGLMHNKFWVIDSKVVITGSMNPTKNGAERNRDNIIVVRNGDVARRYRNEFDTLVNTVPDHVN